MTPRNPGAHFWVRSPKPSEDVWPHDWDVMWWDGEYFWGTNGDGYKADSLVVGPRASSPEEQAASLIAAAPEMLEALRLHKAWSDSERAGPDYGGQSRDTHPDGERIWRAWWNSQLDLCDRAHRATDEALAKAEA